MISKLLVQIQLSLKVTGSLITLRGSPIRGVKERVKKFAKQKLEGQSLPLRGSPLRGVTQWLACLFWEQEAACSNHATPKKTCDIDFSLQSNEDRTLVCDKVLP